MTAPRLVAVIGAPRSGTTWVQRLLVASPHVVSPQETHLFHRFLRPQREAWDDQVATLATTLEAVGEHRDLPGRLIGLPTLLTADDLLDAQRLLVDRLVSRALATRPGASTVVEKSPSNSFNVELIHDLVPDVRFVHVVRDPRAVMMSLRDASKSWGELWAPPDAAGAAKSWLDHVEAARTASRFGPEAYLEVPYEKLRSDTEEVVAGLLEFLGLDDDAATILATEKSQAAAPVFAFGAQVRQTIADAPGSALEPNGFRGAGRRDPARSERWAADVVASKAAAQSGYDIPRLGPLGRPVTPLVLQAQTFALRARRFVRVRRHRS